jgi:hypothetical protein
MIGGNVEASAAHGMDESFVILCILEATRIPPTSKQPVRSESFVKPLCRKIRG